MKIEDILNELWEKGYSENIRAWGKEAAIKKAKSEILQEEMKIFSVERIKKILKDNFLKIAPFGSYKGCWYLGDDLLEKFKKKTAQAIRKLIGEII